MAENSQGNLKWSPELGLRPEGGKNEPEKYGKWQLRLTYLDKCTCNNPNCNGWVARYVDNNELCEEQTFSLRREGMILFENYKARRGSLEELLDLQKVYTFVAINSPEQREEALTSFEEVSAALPAILKAVIELQQQAIATGFIYFYPEVNEESGSASEKFTIERCPLIVSIIEKMREAKAQTERLADDDPAKHLEDEIPEDYFDSLNLDDLFRQKPSGDVPMD